MAPEGRFDPGQRRLAERRLLDSLRRIHRREPLRRDVRVDRLLAEVRAADPAKPSRHRGRQPLALSDAELLAVVDELVVSGALRREGHRVRLPGTPAPFDPIMRERVDALLATLSASGAAPPPAEPLATRLGIPIALVDQLRAGGELVAVGARIDYPRETWAGMALVLDSLASQGPLSVRTIRDALRTTRRHAEAILRWRGERATSR